MILLNFYILHFPWNLNSQSFPTLRFSYFFTSSKIFKGGRLKKILPAPWPPAPARGSARRGTRRHCPRAWEMQVPGKVMICQVHPSAITWWSRMKQQWNMMKQQGNNSETTVKQKKDGILSISFSRAFWMSSCTTATVGQPILPDPNELCTQRKTIVGTCGNQANWVEWLLCLSRGLHLVHLFF